MPGTCVTSMLCTEHDRDPKTLQYQIGFLIDVIFDTKCSSLQVYDLQVLWFADDRLPVCHVGGV